MDDRLKKLRKPHNILLASASWEDDIKCITQKANTSYNKEKYMVLSIGWSKCRIRLEEAKRMQEWANRVVKWMED